ncbi:hypothetical protein SAMN05444369_11828 [Capnocytophaga haemolytica]|jgi:hypothetical protein|uniref:Outer membrane protein beta-barrel domain-containing protein n=1 Tax=Capnocytophaga haemolytica TaxID=45243 RepID=A0AAX2GTZ3_9FLAO|nr:hypothetical protein [Capnocytophaga haemolytica]AMD85480.1 hypothetical protein AXF12_08120 [Capnocytophaga haemolytica]SFO29471.1 hypothetical protein SAMN05444369_11828 [Capnocytophaga haemolytica]SNV01141.1 Uncharacterised protein [Capnocytophaga haemolytica]
MRRIVLVITLLLIGQWAVAQENILSPEYQQAHNPNRWTYGGNIGLTFSEWGTGFTVTPRLGYKVTEDFEVAAQVNYNLQHTRYYRNQFLGVGPSLTYYILRNFYVSSSFEHYFVSQKDKDTKKTFTTEEDALYIGGGYMQQLGERVYMQIGVSYNVLYKKDSSIFSTGIVPNVGIIIGL